MLTAAAKWGLLLARWGLLVFFVGLGVYCYLWTAQSASFSVPAPPIMSEIYKTRAIVFFPMSILSVAVGVLFFICLRPPRRSSDSVGKGSDG